MLKKTVFSLVFLLSAAGCAQSSNPQNARNGSKFIKVIGTRFEREGKPYFFLGTNLWYGANLGSQSEGGNRERLVRELDFLKSLGVTNLRVMGASEGTTSYTVSPSIQPDLGRFDESVLDGLDFLLAETGKRDMAAVVFLNNYWDWTGGMAQYVAWIEKEPCPNPNIGKYTWTQFQEYSAKFYTHEGANAAFREYIRMLILRKNAYTGTVYRDDPTIMSWQLANEPRPGVGDSGKQNFGVFEKWVGETAAYIRSLDPNHLVSTGSEGIVGCLFSKETCKAVHGIQGIDYMTVHLWVLNWSWFDPKRPEKTYLEAESKAMAYLDDHIRMAEEIGKPLVLEEFGIPRDGHSYSPQSGTLIRDKYYAKIFDHIFGNALSGGPFAGSNFWTWGGYGRARISETMDWRKGDEVTGDPPQEPQGRNSVFVSDTSTLEVLRLYAKKMNQLSE